MDPTDKHGAIAARPERVSTGDVGLDRILGGGVFRGAVTILQGLPGAGKTTLANQMAFGNSRNGGSTVYITLLSESHGRMATFLTPMRFFDEKEIGKSIHYVSGYSILVEEGARALLQLIGSEVRARKANLVVLDGLFVVADAGLTESEYRKFINDLALQAEVMGCTVVLLTNSRRSADSPEYTMVDSWIELGWQVVGDRSRRVLEVHKLRGSDFLAGNHSLRISAAGVEVYPRLESYLGHAPRLPVDAPRLSTGVDALDTMMQGGIPTCSNTLVWGATGIGKTTLGYHFLSQCTPASPGLLFGFYESPDECVRDARARGIDLQPLVDNGSLQVMWHAPTEHDLDQLGHDLLANVRRRGVCRLVVDGIDAFEKVAVDPERLRRYIAALTYELRSAGCTSMFTMEVPGVFDEQPLVVAGDRSAIGQNILLMRYAQAGDRIARSLTVLKMRESGFDPRAHAFDISRDGIRIGAPVDPRSTTVDCTAASA